MEKIRIGIHLQRTSEAFQNSPFERKFLDILEYNNIKFLILNVNDNDFWERLKDIDIFIFRYGGLSSEIQLAKTIMPIIENHLGIKCFPNQNTCWHFDDKIRQYYLMKKYGFPMTNSWIFWDKMKCLKWLDKVRFPIVFKLKNGAGSSNVVLLKSKNEAIKIVNNIFTSGIKNKKIPTLNSLNIKNFSFGKAVVEQLKKVGKRIKGLQTDRYWFPNIGYAYFQEFLPGNDYDTRVLIIGKRAFAFRRMNRKNDFRSSGSGIIDYDPKMIDLNHVKKAFEVSIQMKFQSMAFDFLYNENGESEFCEISYTYVDTAVYNSPGYWDDKLNWNVGHFWPQYFILKDLLDIPDLKQPDLKQENYMPKSNIEKIHLAFLKKS